MVTVCAAEVSAEVCDQLAGVLLSSEGWGGDMQPPNNPATPRPATTLKRFGFTVKTWRHRGRKISCLALGTHKLAQGCRVYGGNMEAYHGA